jgi:hypothetical protein
VIFQEAAGDPVAAELVEKLTAEVVVMATVAMRRLELTDRPVEVLLGGGMFQHAELVDAVRASLSDDCGLITVRAAMQPPIVGAALLGLDELASGPEAQERVRRELAEHVGTQSERPVYG